MKRMLTSLLYIASILSIAPFLDIAPTSSSVYAQTHISQTYIDTTIQRAVYLLNESATLGRQRHRQAVGRVRSMVNNLKNQAKGDPNERYIMWRLSELEHQLYLEEEEIREIQQEKNTLTANELLIQFDTALRKRRPDFATLRNLCMRMGEVDTRHANRMTTAYNQRYRNISREAIHSAELALDQGNLELAREEIEYLENNRFFLVINDSQLQSMRNRYNRITKEQDAIDDLDSEIREAHNSVSEFRLSNARMEIQRLRGRLDSHRENLNRSKWQQYSSRIDELQATLDNREDSLVNVTMALIENDKIDEARRYFTQISEEMGLSRDRSAFIDHTILSLQSPDHRASQPNITEGLHTPTEGVFEDMRSGVMQSAQKRADSIRAIEEQKMAALRREQAKQDSIRRAIERKAEMELRANQEKANQISIDIYSLLDRNRTRRARRRFNREQDFLQQYLRNEVFAILAQSVSDERPAATTQEVKTAQQTQQPPPPEPPPESEASSSTTTTAAVVDDDLWDWGPPPEQQPKTQNRTQAQPSVQVENEEQAQEITIEIYSKISENKTKEAREIFNSSKESLKLHLNEHAFNALETTILNSN
ncbi:hypothetical protein QA601_05175 [Chitinispirillales bacterium ANBcel5]|uniref:hypothetical protein n=1 Tax=Cellulosispirillum alkaliphilum TaxID=3039283 RepID=UPI002A596413|nr:hypothetical protein [Chitinispirillales bacterium ANBcel5]